MSVLLGKSQTFHNRQRVGDIMARAANDMSQFSDMIVPGVDIIVDSFTSLGLRSSLSAFLNPQLLLAPLLFTAAFSSRCATTRASSIRSPQRCASSSAR